MGIPLNLLLHGVVLNEKAERKLKNVKLGVEQKKGEYLNRVMERMTWCSVHSAMCIQRR